MAGGCLPNKHIRYVYENTMPDAKLRMLFEDIHKKTMDLEHFPEIQHKWQTVAFVHDVLPAIMVNNKEELCNRWRWSRLDRY
jgi:hypothetical protein